VLAVRPDGMGDVLLAGPAIRAVAARAHVTLWSGPAGADAAARLPGVSERFVRALPWIDLGPERVDAASMHALVAEVRDLRADEAIIFTSFHQSALPTALVLRMAAVARIGAISVDYPGALLDVRHVVPDDCHEVERNLSLARAMGYELPAGDDGRLRVHRPAPACAQPGTVVVHPGASVSARTLAPSAWRAVVQEVAAAGWRVLVTGHEAERPLLDDVVRGAPADTVTPLLADDLDGLVDAIAGAEAIVVGNTGPAHIAAAVGTPVVSCYAPTVPACRWHPWAVPFVLLGDQGVACAGCRARVCPEARQHCLDVIRPVDVVRALESLGVRPVTATRATVVTG
jgi:ADP-heptose:LPS heptosyltransferase